MAGRAVLVTHGSPSEVEAQEEALAQLAARVADMLPGWRVASATLAKPDRLEEVLRGLESPLVYPYFMAQGYFTGRVLPKRLSPFGLTPMRPFGVDPALLTLVSTRVQAELQQQGWLAQDTAMLVAAHGSAVSQRSADAANDFAAALQIRMGFREIRTGFVEQEPLLEPAARGLGQAICLPFFALTAGHMLEDVPEALEEAKFEGVVFPSFIDWPETADVIATALKEAGAQAA